MRRFHKRIACFQNAAIDKTWAVSETAQVSLMVGASHFLGGLAWIAISGESKLT
jgi:hypothetical protein